MAARPRRILVGYDGSETSQRALDAAADLVGYGSTGLGALPFLLGTRPKRRWLGLANALAAGFMTGASAGLAYEGATKGPWRTVLGALAGAAAIAVVSRLLGVVASFISVPPACKGVETRLSVLRDATRPHEHTVPSHGVTPRETGAVDHWVNQLVARAGYALPRGRERCYE